MHSLQQSGRGRIPQRYVAAPQLPVSPAVAPAPQCGPHTRPRHAHTVTPAALSGQQHISLYAQLGVDQDAPLEDIKAVYRDAAKRLHPDLLAAQAVSQAEREQAHDRLVAYNLAWEVLSDPLRRRAYDLELRLVQEAQARFTDASSSGRNSEEEVAELRWALQQAQRALDRAVQARQAAQAARRQAEQLKQHKQRSSRSKQARVKMTAHQDVPTVPPVDGGTVTSQAMEQGLEGQRRSDTSLKDVGDGLGKQMEVEVHVRVGVDGGVGNGGIGSGSGGRIRERELPPAAARATLAAQRDAKRADRQARRQARREAAQARATAQSIEADAAALHLLMERLMRRSDTHATTANDGDSTPSASSLRSDDADGSDDGHMVLTDDEILEIQLHGSAGEWLWNKYGGSQTGYGRRDCSIDSAVGGKTGNRGKSAGKASRRMAKGNISNEWVPPPP